MIHIVAKEGKSFKRIHDGFIMESELFLGIDYSTGEPREDLPDYYEQVDSVLLEKEIDG